MNNELGYNPKIIKALNFAAVAHREGLRKQTNIPYIVHPVEVAMILQENKVEDDLIIAGLLHDTLEDTLVTQEEIKNLFGPKVLERVLGASEELEGRDERPWEERKKHTIEHVREESEAVKLVVCADKLSNIRSMIRDYEANKHNFWQRFTVTDPRSHKWYYEGLVESLSTLENYKMYKDFKRSVAYLFGKVEKE